MTEAEKKLVKVLMEAMDVVEFYADPETYFAVGFALDPPCGDFARDFSDTHVGSKPGKRARKAYDRIRKIMDSL